MPNKHTPTSEDIGNQLRFMGKAIKEFYLTKSDFLLIYIYVLLIELVMSKLAFENKTQANVYFMKNKFGSNFTRKAYDLRNGFVHNTEQYYDGADAIKSFLSIGYNNLQRLEAYAFGEDIGFFTDVVTMCGYDCEDTNIDWDVTT